MSLYHYLVRLETILRTREDIIVEKLEVEVLTLGATLSTEVNFYDKSRLSIFEQLMAVGQQSVERIRYKFHYQDKAERLIFRYDNSPHYPHLATFPAHKHVGNKVVEATPPDLSEVLAEIDGIIYAD